MVIISGLCCFLFQIQSLYDVFPRRIVLEFFSIMKRVIEELKQRDGNNNLIIMIIIEE